MTEFSALRRFVAADVALKMCRGRRGYSPGRRQETDAARQSDLAMKTSDPSMQLEAMRSLLKGSLPMVIYSASCDDHFAGPRYLSDDLGAVLGFPAAELTEDGGLWPSRIHHAICRAFSWGLPRSLWMEISPWNIAGVVLTGRKGVSLTRACWT